MPRNIPGELGGGGGGRAWNVPFVILEQCSIAGS